MYDGNLVRGLVSEVKPDLQTLCIEAEVVTCAQLLAGTMPAEGTTVEGWLVRVMPSDETASGPVDYWAWVKSVSD